MTRHASRLALLLGPLLLLGACGASQQRTARVMDRRLELRMKDDLASGRAVLQPFPGGARVTLTDPSLFSNAGTELDDHGRFILASLIEGLLDPTLVQINVADTTPGATGARLQTVAHYFEESALNPTTSVQPIPIAAAGPAPAGVSITIGVACPGLAAWSGWGYGSGEREPGCR